MHFEPVLDILTRFFFILIFASCISINAFLLLYLATAAMGGGGKSKKKKWSKGKVREKALNLVMFDKPTHKKLLADIPKVKLITTSVLVERLKVSGALARKAMKELAEQGLIKPVSLHQKQLIYTRATSA